MSRGTDAGLRRHKRESSASGTRSRRFGWTDLAVIPLVAVLSVPPLVWFGYEWVVTQDAGRYLLGGWHLVSGRGYTLLGGIPEIKRGPVLPGLLGFLMAIFGRDTESLAWGVRLLALVNPLLAYLLVKRLSGPFAGLLAAVLVALLSYTATNPEAFNIDAVLLTMSLLTLLVLLAAVQKGASSLAGLSGLLLGASIVTKETAFVNLPFALLAVLLLGRDLRWALWHYLGVILVCLPWWAWVWAVSGQVYLVGRFPTGLQIPMMVATLIFVGLAAGAYLSGMIDRFLFDERRRRWTGRVLTLAWAVSLSGFLLSTGGAALAGLSLGDLKVYAAERLAPNIAVWPLLLVAGGYAVWKALRGGPLWRLVGMALLFQVPVVSLITVEGWHQRQFLTPQTLLLCVLAVLVADACGPLLGAVRERRYPVWPRLVVAGSLVVYLIASAGLETRKMLFEHAPEPSDGGVAATRALRMTDWVAENVPAGQNIIVAPLHVNYLAYLDGDRHRLTLLRLDQSGKENPTKLKKHADEARIKENSVYGTPPDTVWLNLGQQHVPCGAASLSVPEVVGQTKREDVGLLMMTSYPTRPGLLSSSSGLADSGAFEIVHEEGEVAKDEGFMLLKSTDRPPENVPAYMGASTVLQLKRCMQAKGSGYAERIRSRFPNGIVLVPGSSRDRVYEDPVAGYDAEAREVVEEVYGGSDTAGSGGRGGAPVGGSGQPDTLALLRQAPRSDHAYTLP